jgi:hypothetical protein
MKMQTVAAILATAALILAVWSTWEINALQKRLDSLSGTVRGQSIDTRRETDGPIEERVRKLEASAPGLGEIMAGIQTHTAKLYYAGKAGNWPLVEFEMTELDEGLAAVPSVRPQENNVPLAPVIDAFRNSQWAALKDVVSRKDTAGFEKAYGDVLMVCNACHQATGKPFIVIIPPTQSPASNQRWEPAGR